MTTASVGQLPRTDSKASIEASSQIAASAPASLMRYSSASGPNSCDSGMAMAPSCSTAM